MSEARDNLIAALDEEHNPSYWGADARDSAALVDAFAAAVLREAAVFVEAMNEGCGQRKPCASCDAREDAAAELRRRADEATAKHHTVDGVRHTGDHYCPVTPEEIDANYAKDLIEDAPSADARTTAYEHAHNFDRLHGFCRCGERPN
jgi:hypothetical protein